MLREFVARQIDGEPHRRWFHNEDFDLYVWSDGDGRRVGFQLCYDTASRQHAFTWIEGRRARHHGVDAPEGGISFGVTPLLVAGGEFPVERVSRDFRAAAENLEPDLREWVLGRLRGAL